MILCVNLCEKTFNEQRDIFSCKYLPQNRIIYSTFSNKSQPNLPDLHTKEVVMRRIIPVMLLLIIGGVCILSIATSEAARHPAALRERLAYLKDLPDVSWVEFVTNNVYIGLKNKPADLKAIVGDAAVAGSKVYGFTVHVWAVDEKYRGVEPRKRPYFCKATARRGEMVWIPVFP